MQFSGKNGASLTVQEWAETRGLHNRDALNSELSNVYQGHWIELKDTRLGEYGLYADHRIGGGSVWGRVEFAGLEGLCSCEKCITAGIAVQIIFDVLVQIDGKQPGSTQHRNLGGFGFDLTVSHKTRMPAIVTDEQQIALLTLMAMSAK